MFIVLFLSVVYTLNTNKNALIISVTNNYITIHIILINNVHNLQYVFT